MNDIEQQLLTLKPAGQSDLARKILTISHRKRQRRRDCVVGLAGLLTGIAATLLVAIGLPGKVIEVPVVQYVEVNNVPPKDCNSPHLISPHISHVRTYPPVETYPSMGEGTRKVPSPSGGGLGSVRRQVFQNTVIPAQAGIQMGDINPVFLDPRLRGSDGKIERVDGLGLGWGQTLPTSPDPLDAWFARYEKLLRHHRETAGRFVVVLPKTPTTLPDGVSPLEYRKKLLEEFGG